MEETQEYAGPIGFRVSWGALLAGALMMLAIAALLWMLGFGITLVTINAGQLGGGAIALVAIAIGVTLVGSVCGALLAGWLQGSRLRRLGAVHGLLACALAFLISTGFWLALAGGAMRMVAGAVAGTAQTAVTATATTAGGTAAGGGNVAMGAQRFLQGLGYSGPESRAMVSNAQGSIQRALHRNNLPSGQQVAASAGDAAGTLLSYLGAAVWIYMGTWLVAMLLSLAFGALGASRYGLRTPAPVYEREPPLTTPPLPSPT